LKKAAIYPGTFDPITFGHINIIKRGLKIFDNIIIAVAIDTTKDILFSVEERLEMIREVMKDENGIKIETFKGLLVDYAKKREISIILRGLRTVQDFEYELQMSLANKKLYPTMETIFMMTEGKFSYFSSSLIKEIAKLGGNLDDMVPKEVQKKLLNKFKKMEVKI